MHTQDEGLVIGVKPFGENKAILTLFTLSHGKISGMVRLNSTKATRAHVQLGNTLRFDWRARLEDQLGSFTIEPIMSRTQELMQNRLSLQVLGSVCELLNWFQERDAHKNLYTSAGHVIDTALDNNPTLLALSYLNFERLLLEEFGNGLDLAQCAATQTTSDLIYISPKTGRAVCAEAGEPYKDMLFPFPQCFKTMQVASPPDLADICGGLKITGHFLAKFHFEYVPNASFEARHNCMQGFLKLCHHSRALVSL